MTTLCDFAPDDPSCATEDHGHDEHPMDDHMMEDDMDDHDDMGMAMMKANLVFLGVSLGVLLQSALWVFRYRTAEGIHELGESLGTNYNELLDNFISYWMMASHGLLFVTQLLSMMGIAVETNIMMWKMVGSADMLMGLIYTIGFFYVHHVYHEMEEDTSLTSA